jgi:phosphoribosylformimino-5-aminoimidazole carboxamide ribotide isomerase
MLLIIPSIDILGGVSAWPIAGPAGDAAGIDPVAIARLFRIENAKTLHVTDLDGAAQGRFTQFDLAGRLISCVDIPIEFSGGIGADDEADRLLGMGACRVVLRPGLVARQPETAARMLAKHGPGKIVAAIEERGRAVEAGGPADESLPSHPVAQGAAAKSMGFRRLLYTELAPEGGERVVNTRMLERLGRATGLRVTASGGVASLDDLRAIEALEPAGVDSVILRKSLYENRFSCQAIWRTAEEGGYPYTAKVPLP